MKVPVYDLARLASHESRQPYPGFEEKNALIIGENKVILVDADGIHSLHDKDATITLINPSTLTKTKVRIKDLIDKIYAKVDEVELGTFVRTFSARIERNYQLLLNSIKEIGLDPIDYPRNPK